MIKHWTNEYTVLQLLRTDLDSLASLTFNEQSTAEISKAVGVAQRALKRRMSWNISDDERVLLNSVDNVLDIVSYEYTPESRVCDHLRNLLNREQEKVLGRMEFLETQAHSVLEAKKRREEP